MSRFDPDEIVEPCGCCYDPSRYPGSGEPDCRVCGHTVLACNTELLDPGQRSERIEELLRELQDTRKQLAHMRSQNIASGSVVIGLTLEVEKAREIFGLLDRYKQLLHDGMGSEGDDPQRLLDISNEAREVHTRFEAELSVFMGRKMTVRPRLIGRLVNALSMADDALVAILNHRVLDPGAPHGRRHPLDGSGLLVLADHAVSRSHEILRDLRSDAPELGEPKVVDTSDRPPP